MVVFRDNFAHMVVNGIFYLNFRMQLDHFSIFYDHHDHGRFQEKFDPRGRQMVAGPLPECIIYIVTRVFYSN